MIAWLRQSLKRHAIAGEQESSQCRYGLADVNNWNVVRIAHTKWNICVGTSLPRSGRCVKIASDVKMPSLYPERWKILKIEKELWPCTYPIRREVSAYVPQKCTWNPTPSTPHIHPPVMHAENVCFSTSNHQCDYWLMTHSAGHRRSSVLRCVYAK